MYSAWIQHGFSLITIDDIKLNPSLLLAESLRKRRLHYMLIVERSERRPAATVRRLSIVIVSGYILQV